MVPEALSLSVGYVATSQTLAADLATADWAKQTLENRGVDRAYVENYCDDCMGWEVKSFNVEMTSPGYMKINATVMAALVYQIAQAGARMPRQEQCKMPG